MTDRKTPMKDAELIPLAVAAAAIIEAGKMVARNSTGYAVEAADIAGLVVAGRADEAVDNSGGSDGDINVLVRRNKAFKYGNSATSPVTEAEIGKDVFVEDDETVAKEPGTNSIIAGKCIGVESDGVWICIPGGKVAAVQDDVTSTDAGATYTAAEQTLINEIKTDFNNLLTKLRTAQIIDS